MPGRRSVAATKSYIASLAALLQIAADWSRDAALDQAVRRLPDDLNDALARDWRPALEPLASAESLYVVGRGPGYAAAQEAALKLKETCGLHAEAVSAAELMHGPLALAGAAFPVVIFSQRDAASASLAQLGAELVAAGVPVISAGPAKIEGALTLPDDERHQSLRPAGDAHPELLSACRRNRPGPRPRSRPAAAPQEGHGDPLMRFALAGARVFDGTHLTEGHAVVIDGARIVALVPESEIGGVETLRVEGLLAPGFVDTQVNGGGGVLFNETRTAAGIAAIGAAHRRFGTTGFLPTFVTDSRERMAEAVAAANDALAAGVPGVLGIHLEGPFLNPARKGVHEPRFMRPIEDADIAIAGSLRGGKAMMTLAPEMVGVDAIRRLVARASSSRQDTRRPPTSRSPPRARPASPASLTSTTRCPRSPGANPASSARRSTTRSAGPASSSISSMSPPRACGSRSPPRAGSG